MAKRPPRRYFWALHFGPDDPELAALSPDARQGLAYATELAEHARERSRSALEQGGTATLAPLTAEDVARRDCLPLIQVRSKVKRARIELFGKDLGDSAIAYRLRMRHERGERKCAERGCEETLPALAHGRRRYCPMHAAPAARVRRHRYGSAGPARPPRPYGRRRFADGTRPLAQVTRAEQEKLERLTRAVLAGDLSEPRHSSRQRTERDAERSSTRAGRR